MASGALGVQLVSNHHRLPEGCDTALRMQAVGAVLNMLQLTSHPAREHHRYGAGRGADYSSRQGSGGHDSRRGTNAASTSIYSSGQGFLPGPSSYVDRGGPESSVERDS